MFSGPHPYHCWILTVGHEVGIGTSSDLGCAELILTYQKIYLHFLSFLKTKMIHVIEILLMQDKGTRTSSCTDVNFVAVVPPITIAKTSSVIVLTSIYRNIQVSAHKWLTHSGRDKMAAIFQTTFSNVFSWMKMNEFWLRFHWSLFLGIQLTIFQHWFR